MAVAIKLNVPLSIVCAIMFMPRICFSDSDPPTTQPLTEGRGPDVETAVVGAPEAEATPGLLMRSLHGTALGRATDDAGIKMGGLVEASITYSNRSAPGGIITGRAFDLERDDRTLNQLLLYFERQTDAEKPWDMGFRIEMMYGADARFSASNGLFDDNDSASGPENQFDITQAYLELVIPIGSGLKTKIGKFITPLGYELVNPSGNAFYSHSFLFNITPYAHTGVLATYQLNDQLAISGGFSRGWDQALEDNNDSIDAIGSAVWKISEKTEAALSFTVGPEQAGNNDRYCTALDLWITHQATDRLTFAVDASYVANAGAAQDSHAAQVYGVAGYAGYKFNDIFTANARVEWFNDTSRVDGFDSTAYEATIGLSITPFHNHTIGSSLMFRPELRYDYADEPIFGNGTDHGQLTAAMDVVFAF